MIESLKWVNICSLFVSIYKHHTDEDVKIRKSGKIPFFIILFILNKKNTNNFLGFFSFRLVFPSTFLNKRIFTKKKIRKDKSLLISKFPIFIIN